MLERRICLQLRGGVVPSFVYFPRTEWRVIFDYARVFTLEKELGGECNACNDDFFIVFCDGIGGTSWVTGEIVGEANFFPGLVIYREIVWE